MTYFSGDYPSALKLFEKGQTNLPQKRRNEVLGTFYAAQADISSLLTFSLRQ
jgi:hypothetical protein